MSVEVPITESTATATESSSAVNLIGIASGIIRSLASLKLTVVLLMSAVFVVWIVTLQQATLDIWELKNTHFHSLFVFIPFDTFFPLKWFPGATDVGIGSLKGLWLPSGLTIITAMLINLTAAHVLRFRIQASGLRLFWGIVTILAGSILTAIVIFNYQDHRGIGGQPPIAWERMWIFMQVALLGLAVFAGYRGATCSQREFWKRNALWTFSLSVMGLLGWSLARGENAFIGAPAMRILWQLFQATVAALVMLAGCTLLFRRKAGIVLLHLGIAGLLLNEIYVTLTNEELRMTLNEGQTLHHAIDVRAAEFVVIDRSDPDFDEMTVLPTSLFDRNRSDASEIIDDELLPFKIRCLKYYKNSDVVRVGPHAENLANAGFGRSYIAVPKKPAAGADANSGVDQASAYVELIDRNDDKPLGTYLVSQLAYAQDIVDTVSIDSRDYQIGLRFKTVYTPFSIQLKDTSRENYVGTDVPKWFSSDFVLDDSENGISSDQRIWMNNPLRYRDLTFYQVSHNEIDGVESSGIQIVRNRGWMIPYLCCMFVVVGLVVQFQQTLASYLTLSGNSNLQVNSTGQSCSPSRAIWAHWPTLVVVGIFGSYSTNQFIRAIDPKLTRATDSEIRLDLFGQLPVTHEGRVQPMDSYARSLARRLSKREEVIDGHKVKQPAIRWLADTMLGVSAADEFEILRIEDLNVQNALDLPRRKGLKYTFSEIRRANTKLFELLVKANETPHEERTAFEKRLAEVYTKSRMWMGAYTAMFPTPGDDPLDRLEIAANLARTQTSIPFLIPTGDPENPWMPMSIAQERIWLGDLARQYQVSTSTELAERLLEQKAAELKPDLVKREIIANMLKYEEIVDGLSKRFGLDHPQQLAQVLSDNWDLFPSQLYADQEIEAAKYAERKLVHWRTQQFALVKDMIEQVNAGDFQVASEARAMVENLSDLKQAYLEEDAIAFNTALERHLTSIDAVQPMGWSKWPHYWEITYNYFGPFYVATCLYLLAFLVSILSWLGMRVPLNRAALAFIVLALVIHFGGIVARIVISGRPPITNLYSSFVVVAACCVLALAWIEWRTKQGLANLLAGGCGFLTMLYAWTLSIDQGDTFTVMRAVLDTQFWLTTHVIIINLGYAATLVAGLLGIGYLAWALFSRGADSISNLRVLSSIIYGTVCFGLLFSFFGTVLGGLWADDSWGRFWGWDPKENGALMIVLWNAAILHARWAGVIRQRGLAAMATFGNVIVLWSWEGVNQLGVGLHAYGGVTTGADSQSLFLEPMFYLILCVLMHTFIAAISVLVPARFFEVKPSKHFSAGG